MLRFVSILVLICGLFDVPPRSVLAEPASKRDETTSPLDEPARREQAKTLFERGVSLYRDERYREALNFFKGAQNLFPNSTITFNIARCCERLSDVPCALRHYREYRRSAQNAADLDEVAHHIQTLELALSKQGVQQVTLFSEPPGALLSIDGVEKGATPWTGELALGQHMARFSMEGLADLEVAFLVDAAHSTDWTYRLQATRAPTAAPPPREAAPVAVLAAAPPTASRTLALPQRRSARVGAWTWAALGSGAAALGTAGVLEALRARSEQDVRDEATQLERLAAYDRMHDYQTAARIGAGVAVALTAIGVTLLTIDLTGSRRGGQAAVAVCAGTACRLDLRGQW